MSSNFSLGVLDVGTLTNALQLAPRLEELGYSRYWVSEHHGENSITTPLIAISLLGGMTSKMRVGSAGVLLRFQSPLVVAQTFRTFQWLFDGRVDLGLARATVHSKALEATLLDGRPLEYTSAQHSSKVELVQMLLTGRVPEGHAMHGASIEPSLHDDLGPPPLWVLSTTAGGAALAARLGAHYSYHDYYGREGAECVKRYIDEFKPSPELAAPSWNVCIDAFVADTEAEARATRVNPLAKDAEGNRFFAGGPGQFEDFLGNISAQYQTKNIILSTIKGHTPLEPQYRSFELALQAASRLWGP